jgi:hypothetical protein
MLALIPVNPYGTAYYGYLWRGLDMARAEIPEWNPIWRGIISFPVAAFAISLIVLVYVAARRGWRTMPGLAILGVLAAAGALHVRMLPFYAVAWTAYAPGYLASLPAGTRLAGLFRRPRPWFQAAWLAIAVFFLGLTIVCRPWRLEVPAEGAPDAAVYPVGAVEYLSRAHFHGNLMTPFEYGAYVSWKLYPAVRVAIDSRYEVAYPEWWTHRVLDLYRAQPGWRGTLAAYPTDAVLVRRVEPLSPALRQEPGWKRVYADSSYELYARPWLNLPIAGETGRPIPGRFP